MPNRLPRERASDEYAADFEAGSDAPARLEVDPRALFTREEISEQLFLSLPLHQREHYGTDEFDVETAPADYGASRMCAYRFQSRDSVGGGPTWHSDFDLMVFPSNAIVSITRFPGRQDDGGGGPDAGRVVLLRRIAERLP